MAIYFSQENSKTQIVGNNSLYLRDEKYFGENKYLCGHQHDKYLLHMNTFLLHVDVHTSIYYIWIHFYYMLMSTQVFITYEYIFITCWCPHKYLLHMNTFLLHVDVHTSIYYIWIHFYYMLMSTQVFITYEYIFITCWCPHKYLLHMNTFFLHGWCPHKYLLHMNTFLLHVDVHTSIYYIWVHFY